MVFLEFDISFTQLLGQDQRLVGGWNKVLLFLKIIYGNERMTLGIQQDHKNGAIGLMEDWWHVKQICLNNTKEGKWVSHMQVLQNWSTSLG